MKKISIIIALIIFPFLSNAQDFVDQLIEKYQGQKGFTTVIVNKGLLDLAAAMDDDKDLEKMKGMIDNIRIIAMEDYLNTENINFYNEIISQVDVGLYQELMTVKESDNDVVFFVKYAGKDIDELLLIVGGSDDNAVISIKGKINIKEMASLSKSIHMNGLEHLSELENY